VTPAVVGIGTTPFARRTRASASALAARAIEAAVRDARIGFDEIDGLVRFDRGAAWEYDLPGVMRLRALDYYGAVPDGPGSAPALVRLAAMAVSLGLARVVVGYHARTEARPGAADVLHAAALLARRQEPRVAAITRALRRAAARNPRALNGAIPSAAGGCAFVMSALERPGRPGRKPVRVLGSMQEAIPSASRHLVAWLASRREGVLRAAARRLYRDAGLRPADVDVACLYAAPGALVLPALGDYGLGERGAAGLPRRPRVNPHGGQLEASLDGINDVIEAVRQLRGEAASQVRGARVALVAGSPLEPTSAVLLGVPA
jgi:acetyl-CoA acetyltransferase